jgi:hypothetical protein
MHIQDRQTSASLAVGVRDANERIALQAERFEVRSGIPMLCECGDPACNELFLTSLEGYRRARGVAPFLIVAGHR